MISVTDDKDRVILCPEISTARDGEMTATYIKFLLDSVSEIVQHGKYRPAQVTIQTWKQIKPGLEKGVDTLSSTHFTFNGKQVPLLTQAVQDDLSQGKVDALISSMEAKMVQAPSINKAEWAFVKAQLQSHTFRTEGWSELAWRKTIG